MPKAGALAGSIARALFAHSILSSKKVAVAFYPRDAGDRADAALIELECALVSQFRGVV
jgi:hypothetical protein